MDSFAYGMAWRAHEACFRMHSPIRFMSPDESREFFATWDGSDTPFGTATISYDMVDGLPPIDPATGESAPDDWRE